MKKVTEENGEKKVETIVKKAEVKDIPPEVFHELSKNEDTFNRFIEESGFDRKEVEEVIEQTKNETYLSTYLVRIDDKGEIVELSDAAAPGSTGEEEKKTLTFVVKEIAAKLFGTGEQKEGDPSLVNGGEGEQPNVTLIAGEDLPGVSVSKPVDPGTVDNKGTNPGTSPGGKQSTSPAASAPAGLKVASLEETVPPVTVPKTVTELLPEKEPTPAPVPAPAPTVEDDEDDDSSGGSSDDPDPEPQPTPTPPPVELPQDIGTSGLYVILSETQNANVIVTTDSTVQAVNMARDEDDIKFTSNSFGYGSMLSLSSELGALGTYYATVLHEFTVPASVLEESQNIVVRTGAYLPATVTTSDSKSIILSDGSVEFKVRNGSDITQMSIDRDASNVYITSDSFNANVIFRIYLADGSYIPCTYADSKYTVPIASVKGKDPIQLMAYVPAALPCTIGADEKLVATGSDNVMMSTGSGSLAGTMTLSESGSDKILVKADGFVPGMQLTIKDGETDSVLNTYEFSMSSYGYLVNKSIFTGHFSVVFSAGNGTPYALPDSFGREGKLYRLSASQNVYLWTSDSGVTEYGVSLVGDKLRFTYGASLGASNTVNLYATAGQSSESKLNTKQYYYDYTDNCIYVPVSVIGSSNVVRVEVKSGFSAQFPDDEVSVGTDTIVMAGDYSDAYFQTKFKVADSSNVTSMTITHRGTDLIVKSDSFDIDKELMISGESVGRFEYSASDGGFVVSSNTFTGGVTYSLKTYDITEWMVGSSAIPMLNGSTRFTLKYDSNGVTGIEDTALIEKGIDSYNVVISGAHSDTLTPTAGSMLKVAVTGTTSVVPTTYFATNTASEFAMRIPFASIGNGNNVVITTTSGVSTMALSATSPVSYNATSSNDPTAAVAFTSNSETPLTLDFNAASEKIKVTASGMGRSNAIWLFTAEPSDYGSSHMFDNIIGQRHYYDFDDDCMYISLSELGTNKNIFVRYKTALTSRLYDDDIAPSESLLYLNTDEYVPTPSGFTLSEYTLIKMKIAPDSLITEGIYAESRGFNGFTIESRSFTDDYAMELLDESGQVMSYGYESEYNSNNARFKIEFSTLSEGSKHSVRIINASSWTLGGTTYSDVSKTITLGGSARRIVNKPHEEKELQLDLVDNGESLKIKTKYPSANWVMTVATGDYYNAKIWSGVGSGERSVTIPISAMGSEVEVHTYALGSDPASLTIPISESVSKSVSVNNSGCVTEVSKTASSSAIRVTLTDGTASVPWIISDGTAKTIWYTDYALAEVNPYIDLALDATDASVSVTTSSEFFISFGASDVLKTLYDGVEKTYTRAEDSGDCKFNKHQLGINFTPESAQSSPYKVTYTPTDGDAIVKYYHTGNQPSVNAGIDCDSGGTIKFEYGLGATDAINISDANEIVYIQNSEMNSFSLQLGDESPDGGYDIYVDPDNSTVKIGLHNGEEVYSLDKRIKFTAAGDFSLEVDPPDYTTVEMPFSSFGNYQVGLEYVQN